MKKFIIQLLLFIAPLLIPFVMLFVYFNVSLKNKIEHYTFQSTINKIVIGDSHVHLAINDKLLNNTVNISQNSEGFIYSYFKLKALIKNNPQIDTIFLGAGYHSFAGYYDDHVLLSDIASRYFFILPTAVQIAVFKNTKSPGLLIAKSFLNGAKTSINFNKECTFLGSYENYSTKVSTSDTSIKSRITQAYYVQNKLAGFSTSNMYYFHKICQLCNENKITLYVINTPTHTKYKEQVPIKFKNKYYLLIKNENVKLVEFDSLALPDNDFLPDGDHVTGRGADLATKYLQQKLKNTQ